MAEFAGKEKDAKRMFPLFVDIEDKAILVVGGGRVASRRIKQLLNFTKNIRVVAKEISEEICGLEDIELIKREYRRGDMAGAYIVLAATDDRQVNSGIAAEAREQNIYCSVADRKEEGSLWFPALVLEGGLVAGIVSETGEHGRVKKAKRQISEVLNSEA